MRRERFAEESIPLVGEMNLDAPPVRFNRFAPDQSFIRQTVEYAGQGSFGHERRRGQFGAGHALRVAQRRNDVELRRSQLERPNMAAIGSIEGKVGFDQRTQDLETRIIFEVGKFHVEGAA